jgi:hypothetical protein
VLVTSSSLARGHAQRGVPADLRQHKNAPSKVWMACLRLCERPEESLYAPICAEGAVSPSGSIAVRARGGFPGNLTPDEIGILDLGVNRASALHLE